MSEKKVVVKKKPLLETKEVSSYNIIEGKSVVCYIDPDIEVDLFKRKQLRALDASAALSRRRLTLTGLNLKAVEKTPVVITGNFEFYKSLSPNMLSALTKEKLEMYGQHGHVKFGKYYVGYVDPKFLNEKARESISPSNGMAHEFMHIHLPQMLGVSNANLMKFLGRWGLEGVMVFMNKQNTRPGKQEGLIYELVNRLGIMPTRLNSNSFQYLHSVSRTIDKDLGYQYAAELIKSTDSYLRKLMSHRSVIKDVPGAGIIDVLLKWSQSGKDASFVEFLKNEFQVDMHLLEENQLRPLLRMSISEYF